jgi:uncharacterized protein (TIGR03435 family)
MKRRTKSAGKLLNRSLGLFNQLSREEIEASRDQALKFLESQPAGHFEEEKLDSRPGIVRRRSQWPLVAAVAAAVVMAILLPSRILQSAPAVLSDAEGSRNIQYDEIVRPRGSTSAMLAMADGSQVEMRSQSVLSLERTDDGIRIFLNTGGVIVNAAGQHSGNLYVQTKDMTASVIGTVSLVNAEEQGSRVAAIGGEVRVQQGATEKKLRPGEQTSTNPLMAGLPVKEELSWSRHAEAHLALLQQASVPAVAAVAEKFEETIIKLSAPPPNAGNGRGVPGGGSGGPSPFPCTPMTLQVTPGRFIATRATVQGLVGLAYGNPCAPPDVLSGGPEWIKSDRYDIQALIPAGSPVYTRQEFVEGKAPKLQMMLQNLLADRLKLGIRRDLKEMPVYNLVVVNPGKVKLSEDQTGATSGPLPDRRIPMMYSGNTTLSAYARALQGFLGRPVFDKTGLKGLYDFFLQFPEIAAVPPPPPGTASSELSVGIRDLLPSKLEQQFGLKLEPARVPMEVFFIEHVERPSEN